jgi:predicted dehydrogenase
MDDNKIDRAAPIKVAILGCGLIGAQWDQPSDDNAGNGGNDGNDGKSRENAFSLTHAAAFSRHPGSVLVAVCDQDQAKAAQAAARWGCQAFSDPTHLLAETRPDLVVIATSSAARMALLAPALAAGVKTFVIEKPLAATLAEGRDMVAALQAAGAKALVNFSRHWDPSMRQMRERIASGAFGGIQRLIGLYGKGLTNNGSHMIDLVGCLCNAKPVRVRALDTPLDPHEALWSKGKDRALDAQIVYADQAGRQFHLSLLGTDQSAFTCFELRIIGSEAQCNISQGGRRITWTALQADSNYLGYTIPAEPFAIQARAMEAMDCMADEALQLALGNIDAASCDAANALRTASTVQAVLLSAQENGRWVALDAMAA